MILLPAPANGQGIDSDGDGVPDSVDNCPSRPNPIQSDWDGANGGDECDLRDRLIFVDVQADLSLHYQLESWYSSFHIYRGDVSILRSTGAYSQERFCAQNSGVFSDGFTPSADQAALYLVTGSTPSGLESSLGRDSFRLVRLSSDVCVVPGPILCSSNADCGIGVLCRKAMGNCPGLGHCGQPPLVCPAHVFEHCGCNGQTYSNDCVALRGGTSVDYQGACGSPPPW